MKLRTIPNTTIEVSTICLGTMTFGTPVAEAEAVRLVHYASDKGINFIDTANMYEGYARYAGSAGGVAEEIVGKAIAGRRGDFIVATKVGMKVGETAEDEGTSAAAIRKHLELSLRRLGVDYIDLYYLHKPDPNTPIFETLTALNDVIKAGKIRHFGVSNYSAEQLSNLLSIADANGLPRPVIIQPGMSLLKQDICEDLLPLCMKEGIAAAPYQVLQGGLLTGKYRRGRGVPAGSRKAEIDNWVWDLEDDLFDKLEAFENDADSAGLAITRYAIKWALNQPAVISPIIGVKREEQVDDAVAAVTPE
ncbi:MAG: aldo/keto reductase [Spirochaetales bacterium]|nr:aldo/keto reductase [Spirochaetales bacterium]